MKKITLTTVGELARGDLLAIVVKLTRPGSEFQAECNSVRNGGSSATPIALWHDAGRLRGWCCSHVWQNQQTLEMFVEPAGRQSGIASALAAVMVAAGVIDPRETLVVFSPVTARIANRIGCAEVLAYQLQKNVWVLMP